MPSIRRAFLPAAVLAMLLLPAPTASANANVAALQVALKALHHYGGPVDGLIGPQTRWAVRRFQRRHGLAVDGIAGPRTRRALGKRGRPAIGSRLMRRGQRGFDIAALQYMLGRRGFSTGIDGGFGPATDAALRRFQRARGLAVDGVAGRQTISALKRRTIGRSSPMSGPSGPVAFLRPVNARVGDGFGFRWGRMHTGVDFPAPSGTRVNAAGRGVTSFAGWNSGGYGYLVIVKHRLGFETWYAHLSRITSWPGEQVVGGTRIGLVGSTGRSTGPHLHWEVRHNGVPINPLPRLLNKFESGGTEVPTGLECTGLKGPKNKRRAKALPGHGGLAVAELPPCRR